MDKYVVTSEAISHYHKGQAIKVETEVGYNCQLDHTFGAGYAFKCAKMNARHTKGRLFAVDINDVKEIKLK